MDGRQNILNSLSYSRRKSFFILNFLIFLLPYELIGEIRKKISEKKYLSKRISQSTAEKFITALTMIAYIPLPITDPIPKVGRDVKDDYLLAYALVGSADYVVTGDEDLLVLGKVGTVHIVSPAAFHAVIT